jgi:hypothetical protein
MVVLGQFPGYSSSADGPACERQLACVLDAPGATTGKCRKLADGMCTK